MSETIKIMTPEGKEMELVFQEGCFDSLLEDGLSLEEIEELKRETIEMFKSGKAFEGATPVSEEELAEFSKPNTRH